MTSQIVFLEACRSELADVECRLRLYIGHPRNELQDAQPLQGTVRDPKQHVADRSDPQRTACDRSTEAVASPAYETLAVIAAFPSRITTLLTQPEIVALNTRATGQRLAFASLSPQGFRFVPDRKPGSDPRSRGARRKTTIFLASWRDRSVRALPQSPRWPVKENARSFVLPSELGSNRSVLR